MAWTINAIELPMDPYEATVSYDGEIKSAPIPGTLPVLLTLGKKPITLSVEGWIAVTGMDKDDLDTNYVTPIAAVQNTLITLSGARSCYNGQWILKSFVPTESNKIGMTAYKYKMELQRGSQHVVI